MVLVDLKQVSYQVKEKSILESIDLKIQPHSVSAVVGPNGAGKSTLLSLLSREIGDGKNISFKGEALKNWKITELSRQKAKFSQDHNASIPLKVGEVVMMGRYPYFKNRPRPEDFAVTKNLMRQMEILGMQNRDYKSLSGGEKQRVHLARVFSQLENKDGSHLLLLDEPLNNLDVKHQHRLMNLIENFAARGNAVVVVMHDLNLTARFAHQIILMKNGKILSCDTPKEIFREELIGEAYDFSCQIFKNPVDHQPTVVFGT